MLGTGPVRRRIEALIRDRLSTFRVVVLHGPRQSGKTTLARRLVGGGTFLSLDDPTLLPVALDDPVGFVAHRARPVVIDEIQRGGDDLVRAVKLAVDADPSHGQFLLTGSTSFLTVPVLSESLAGRAVFADLAPFSEVEIEGAAGGLLARLVDEPNHSGGSRPAQASLLGEPPSKVAQPEYAERIARGGYPEVLGLSAGDRRVWFDAYVRTTVSRDIVEVTGARRAAELPRLLRIIAARTAGGFVLQDVHRDLGMGSAATTADYVSYLEMTYLVARLPTWSPSAATRAKRHPKVYLTDTGLAAALLGVTAESLLDPTEPARGPLYETFAVNELRRQAAALDDPPGFHQYRDSRGREIDLVLESPGGRLICVEIKAGSTVRPADARTLGWFRDLTGDRFELGVVLYAGRHPVALADRIVALPLSYLWEL